MRLVRSKYEPEKVGGCDECYFKRTKFVGGRGNPKARIVIVGESPGATELTHGLPLIGPSGKVFTDAVEASGYDLTEDDYYIINAMECLPRKVKRADENTRRLQAGTEACRSRVQEIIARHPRDVIIALGNSALWSVTGNYGTKITQVRGRVFQTDLAERGVVASVHPAFLLRGGGSWQKFKTDIKYALDLAHGLPYRNSIKPEWVVAETLDDVYDFVDYTYQRAEETGLDIIGADIETGGFDCRVDEILCIGWALEGDEVFIVPEALLEDNRSLNYRGFITPHRRGGKFKWHWHNGKFDIQFLWKYGFEAGVDHDSLLMSYTMEERRGFHDLEQVASDWLGAPDYKNMLKPYLPKKDSSYRVIPKPVLYKYLALDVSNTLQLAYSMLPALEHDEKNRKLYYDLLLPASELLAHVEENGVLVDFEEVGKNADYYQEEIEKVVTEIHEISQEHLECNINPNSPIQVADLLYDAMKLGPRSRGTAEEVLERLPQVKIVKLIRQHRKLAKAYGTYVKNLPKQVSHDNRVHSSYLLHGTPTGRLASRGPNMQNQPRGPRIRSQFVAGLGRELIEMDLDQAELRSLAALSGDKELCRIYNTPGVSLHKEVSIKLWGNSWIDDYALTDNRDPRYIAAKENYMITKNLNFGIVYGRTAESIADEFETPVREAQKWLDMWATRFPEAWEYIQRCRAAPAKSQNLVTVFGRRKRAGVVTRDALRDLQNEAANFPHQSLASDITLVAAIELCALFAKYGVLIINLIHDAILFEVPQDLILQKDLCTVTRETMRRIPVDHSITRVPFESDAKKGYRWGDLHDFDFDAI